MSRYTNEDIEVGDYIKVDGEYQRVIRLDENGDIFFGDWGGVCGPEHVTDIKLESEI